MKTVFITGANRGIGLEFVRQYSQAGWGVHCTCRNLQGAKELRKIADTASNNVKIHILDVSDFKAIDVLADELNLTKLDLLINNAGYFGPGDASDAHSRAQQDLMNIDFEGWGDLFRINTMAPVKLAQAFLKPLITAQGTVATISSRLASITQNDGGLYPYRTSKNAVNAAMVALAHDFADQNLRVLCLSPGWVATEMGGSGASVSVEKSVAGLREVINQHDIYKSGSYVDFEGTSIEW